MSNSLYSQRRYLYTYFSFFLSAKTEIQLSSQRWHSVRPYTNTHTKNIFSRAINIIWIYIKYILHRQTQKKICIERKNPLNIKSKSNIYVCSIGVLKFVQSKVSHFFFVYPRYNTHTYIGYIKYPKYIYREKSIAFYLYKISTEKNLDFFFFFLVLLCANDTSFLIRRQWLHLPPHCDFFFVFFFHFVFPI